MSQRKFIRKIVDFSFLEYVGRLSNTQRRITDSVFRFVSLLLTFLLEKLKGLPSVTVFLGQVLHQLPRRAHRMQRGITITLLAACVILAGNFASAQVEPVEPPRPIGSLKKVEIPKPENLKDFVKDEKKAIKLGKALFWDMQVGSDGVMSCATCHFRAGIDTRSKNSLHPGPDLTVNNGVNYQLTAADFPFHKLADPDNRFSTVLSESNDVAGSQGVFLAKFNGIIPGSSAENTTILQDPVFNVNGTSVRQVTGRNAPSVVNAVFNFRNFWDGRAQNIFNGVNPFGLRDPNAKIYKAPKKDSLQAVQIQLPFQLWVRS
jgi:Di-haem cytochrome c peroxidase